MNRKIMVIQVVMSAGHTLGLNHDGRFIPDPDNPDGPLINDEYYGGHGGGATGWAPIMGSGYTKQLNQLE